MQRLFILYKSIALPAGFVTSRHLKTTVATCTHNALGILKICTVFPRPRDYISHEITTFKAMERFTSPFKSNWEEGRQEREGMRVGLLILVDKSITLRYFCQQSTNLITRQVSYEHASFSCFSCLIMFLFPLRTCTLTPPTPPLQFNSKFEGLIF